MPANMSPWDYFTGAYQQAEHTAIANRELRDRMEQRKLDSIRQNFLMQQQVENDRMSRAVQQSTIDFQKGGGELGRRARSLYESLSPSGSGGGGYVGGAEQPKGLVADQPPMQSGFTQNPLPPPLVADDRLATAMQGLGLRKPAAEAPMIPQSFSAFAAPTPTAGPLVANAPVQTASGYTAPVLEPISGLQGMPEGGATVQPQAPTAVPQPSQVPTARFAGLEFPYDPRQPVRRIEGKGVLEFRDPRRATFIPLTGGEIDVSPAPVVMGSESPQAEAARLAAMGATAKGYTVDTSMGAPRYVAKDITINPTLNPHLQSRLAEANARGAAIETDGLTPAQVENKLTAWAVNAGDLNDHQAQMLHKISSHFDTVPIRKHAEEAISGYRNTLNGLAEVSGNGDKIAIEGLQKIVNPGGVVQVSTMKNFAKSSGLIERMTPEYVAQHFTKGAFLTPAQRDEMRRLAQFALSANADELDQKLKATKAEAKASRIPDPVMESVFFNPYRDALDANGGSAGASPTNTRSAESIRSDVRNGLISKEEGLKMLKANHGFQ